MNATKITATQGGPVHIICILDQSTSMGHLTDSVISGFNEFVQEQQKLDGDAVLSTILFDSTVKTLHNRIPLNDVPKLTRDQYRSQGWTALNDGIGKALTEYDDARAIVFINTDGEENSSKNFKTEDVKSMVKRKQELGWEFMFVGAGIDAFAQGGANYGLSVADSVSVSNTSAGTGHTYSRMSSRAKSYRGA